MTAVLATDPRPGGRPSMWLTYGGPGYPASGIVGELMGARTLAGLYLYPQLDLCRPLDPTGKDAATYNRFALVNLYQKPLSRRSITFKLECNELLSVTLSPLHPALRQLGVRYALTFGSSGVIQSPPFQLLYRSQEQDFAIWQLPEDDAGSKAPTSPR